jgi:hypothetical protein
LKGAVRDAGMDESLKAAKRLGVTGDAVRKHALRSDREAPGTKPAGFFPTSGEVVLRVVLRRVNKKGGQLAQCRIDAHVREGEDMGENPRSEIEQRKRNETDAKAGDKIPTEKKGDTSSRLEESEGPAEGDEKREVVEKLKKRES